MEYMLEYAKDVNPWNLNYTFYFMTCHSAASLGCYWMMCGGKEFSLFSLYWMWIRYMDVCNFSPLIILLCCLCDTVPCLHSDFPLFKSITLWNMSLHKNLGQIDREFNAYFILQSVNQTCGVEKCTTKVDSDVCHWCAWHFMENCT